MSFSKLTAPSGRGSKKRCNGTAMRQHADGREISLGRRGRPNLKKGFGPLHLRSSAANKGFFPREQYYPCPKYISQLNPKIAAIKHPKQYAAYRTRSRSVFFVIIPNTTDVNSANSTAASK